MNLLITGASGFVGQNLIGYLNPKVNRIETISLRNNNDITIPSYIEVVIHLAGKAHDLKKTSNDAEYFEVNTQLTKKVYNAFEDSKANTFIYMSSVKAVADNPTTIVDENTFPMPKTAYGKSKLEAEEYLLSRQEANKRLFILRPCMIHGPNNKGNLSLLFNIVKKKIPYPLGSFSNKRSFLSVGNFCFIINELIENHNIPSGIYTLADDESFSTTQIVELIGKSMDKQAMILSLPRSLIKIAVKIGDLFCLPFSSENLQKLTQSYEVSNKKIKMAMGRSLPISATEGFSVTLNSFKK